MNFKETLYDFNGHEPLWELLRETLYILNLYKNFYCTLYNIIFIVFIQWILLDIFWSFSRSIYESCSSF